MDELFVICLSVFCSHQKLCSVKWGERLSRTTNCKDN